MYNNDADDFKATESFLDLPYMTFDQIGCHEQFPLYFISLNHWVSDNYATPPLSLSEDLENSIKCATVWLFNW